MTFQEVLAQVIDWLQREQRLSYRAIKRQFALDEDYLEDLKEELLYAKRLAVDEENRVLVWSGGAAPVASPAPKPPPIAYTPPYLTEKILTSRSALEGERKQVTVLFADLQDSTALIRDLDPEAAQQLLDPALHLMMQAVHRFEGTVNQVLGDGIMALFGAPVAHEDHALRACYAALAMQAAMRPYADEMLRTHGIPMQMRVGLNSGEVVVRTIGNDLHMDYSAVGHTTHLAARMEQLATPGSITLTGTTLRLVDGRVRVTARGPVPVKGMTEPVDVYELTGASTVRRRLQAAVARGLTRFVGRDTEIEVLRQALEQAKAGQGQMVAVVGEAGVGKSRLVYEFLRSHHTQGWLILEAASVSYGKATPYFPVAELLRRYVHIEDGDEPRTMRAKVTGQVLTLDQALQDAIPSLLALLNVLPEESPFARLDPPRKRQLTLAALKRLVLRESELQPLLLVFEDLHWIDFESQALLDSLVDSLPTARLLLVVNYRPEYRHAWGSKTYYTQLRLDPLPPESAEALLDTLLGDHPGLAALKQRLIARTEGNPFFLEETVQTLVETQVLVGERGAYRLAQEAPTLQMPATVHAVLAARIDRLPADAKRLLQTAAVLGAEVPLGVLQTIVALSEGALHQGLAHLQAAEFLYETRLFPERVYTFKHALTREVAYGSLLQERRRVLHARIVDVLETQHGDRLPDQVERLAYHAWRGEIWDKAVAYARQAGSQAAAHSAYREAAACYEQALAALRHVPDNRRAREQTIDLHVALRGVCHALGENWQYFDHLYEAETLAIALDDQRRQAQASNNLATCYWWVGDYERARTYSQQCITVAETLGDVVLQLYGRYILGLLYFYQGSYGQALDGFRWVITTSKADPSLDYLSSSGGSLVTFSHVALSLSQAEYGTFTEGLAYGTEGIRRAETVDHLYSRILGQTFVGFLYLRKGDLQEAVRLLESGLELCRSGNMPRFVPDIASFLGAALTLGGRLAEALRLLEDAVQQGDAMHFMAGQALRVAHLGEAYSRAGRAEEALRQAQRALELARAHQERGHEAYALRLFGDIALQNKPLDFDQAETHYQHARTLAEALGMRPLQAHCHRGLGTVYSQTGQAEPARAELSTAIDMYRDMAMTLWLPETEAALAEVESW